VRNVVTVSGIGLASLAGKRFITTAMSSELMATVPITTTALPIASVALTGLGIYQLTKWLTD
jgi:hypothetical protein